MGRFLGRFLIVLALLVPAVARGQGGVPANPIQIVDSLGRPRAGVTVTFCQSGGTGVPCTPLANIYTDAALTTQIVGSTVTTDGQGNLPVFYAAPGTYKYTVTGTGITPSGPFTATVSLVNGSAATLSSVTSTSPNPAQSGVLRLASTDSVAWRNNANTADTSLAKLGAASGGVPTDTFQFQNATGAAPIWGFPVIASSSVALGVPVTGAVRLSTTDTITWRNNAGTGDVALQKNNSDQLLYNSVPVALSYTATSAGTNFGTNLTAVNIVASMPVTAAVQLVFQPLVSLVGVGCGAGTNSVNIASVNWTAPGGTAESIGAFTAVSISANGTIDTGSTGGQAQVVTNIPAAKAGTAITYTTSSTLASAGCSTIPQYTVYAKAIF